VSIINKQSHRIIIIIIQNLRPVIARLDRDREREFAAGTCAPVEDIDEAVADSWPGIAAQTTATTDERARMDSRIKGPTEWITTMVFLLAAATAATRSLPWCQESILTRSPGLFSTVMQPSPESELMKTRAVAAEAAAEVPAEGESVVKTVPSVEACTFIASRGAMG